MWCCSISGDRIPSTTKCESYKCHQEAGMGGNSILKNSLALGILKVSLRQKRFIRETDKRENIVLITNFNYTWIDRGNAWLCNIKQTKILEMLNDCTIDQLIIEPTRISDPKLNPEWCPESGTCCKYRRIDREKWSRCRQIQDLLGWKVDQKFQPCQI